MLLVIRGCLSDSFSESKLSGGIYGGYDERNISNITEITKLMDESKATGIMTKGPDVNESYLKFSVNRKGDIRFGLGALREWGKVLCSLSLKNVREMENIKIFSILCSV